MKGNLIWAWCALALGGSVHPATASILWAGVAQAASAPIQGADQPWSYDNRPPGYFWIAQKNEQTGSLVYYGLAPVGALPPLSPGETVYVGPDSVFYHFKHAPPIVPCDLANKWNPNAPLTPLAAEAIIPNLAANAMSPNPWPSASPIYHYVIRPPQTSSSEPNGAHIFEIDVNEQQISSRGPLFLRVLTSMNVNVLYVHGASRTMTVPERAPGDFEFTGMIPALPFFARGRSSSAQFEATTIDGCRTTVDVPFFINR